MLHFLNPTLIFFASAAALPILLHLFRRQKIRDVAFATVRFVQRTKRKTRSKISIKQLLVLLLRISILAFLALALARPMLTPADTGHPNAKAPNAAPIYAIVLDDSLSMNYRHAGTSWFTRARNRALEVVSALPFEAQIAVASSSFPGIQLTREKADAHDLIMNIRATERPASLPRALQRTVSAMKDKGASRNVIYLFTDMTAGSWGDVGISPDQSKLELGADIALHIIDCGNEDPTNRAITSVEHIGEPVLQGAILTLRTKIVAIGKPSTELVQFEFDGRIADRREIDLVEDRTEELTFRASITSPGNHWGRVRLLNPDALPQDNTRGFALDASRSVSVLCIDDTYTISNPRSGRSFFFRTALSPWLSSRGIFRVDIAAPRKLHQKDLASYDLLAIMSRNGPLPNGWRRISDFVAGGGALFVSLGKNIEPKNYSGPAARETLPAIPYGTADLTEATGHPGSPRIVSPNHPLIDSLEAAGADITRSQFSSCSKIQPSESAHVMLGFPGDHPALVIGGPGERVAVFSGSLTGRSSDLARRPEFVPFCQELVLSLVPASGGRIVSHSVGDHVPIRVRPSPWPTRITVDPPGQAQPIRVMPGANPKKRIFWNTDDLGRYRVNYERRKDKWHTSFFINPDPDESDLHRISQADVQNYISAGLIKVHANTSEAQRGLFGSGKGWKNIELAPFLIATVLLLCLCELFLSNRLYGSSSENRG